MNQNWINWTMVQNVEMKGDTQNSGQISESSDLSSFLHHLTYILTCSIGLGGNTFLIYIVSRSSHLKTTLNLYILNLTISHNLFLLRIPFTEFPSIINWSLLGKFICKIIHYSTAIPQSAAPLFLLIMATDQYFMLCHPENVSKWRTPCKFLTAIFFTWIFSALTMIPIFIHGDVMEVQNKSLCRMDWADSVESTFVISSFFLGFGLPFTLILGLYLLILWWPWTGNGIMTGSSSRGNFTAVSTTTEPTLSVPQLEFLDEGGRERSHQKLNKILVLITILHFLLWLSHWMTQIDQLYKPGQNHTRSGVVSLSIPRWLCCLNSVLTPILYILLEKDFRMAVKKVCTCSRSTAQATLDDPAQPGN